MKYTRYLHRKFVTSVILFITILLMCSKSFAVTTINIGVRAHSGHSIAIKKWSGTAQYLNKKIPGYNFIIKPIVEFSDMKQAVVNNEVDLVLTNPAAYIELEKEYGVTRIATLINRRGEEATKEFGAIIFTHRKRFDINKLSDLQGKSFVGVHPQAFGGWWMALGELKNNNINPYEYFRNVSFAGTQESVVFSVINDKVDAGTVRTGIIERLAKKGDINLNDIKILNQRQDDFSLPHSTDLYPEWPIAKTSQTSAVLAEKIAEALFEMKQDNTAAVTGNYTGWTVPLSYKKIHMLLQDLKVGAYADYGEFSFAEVANKYRLEIVLVIIFFVFGVFIIIYEQNVNRVLTKTKQNLEKEVRYRKNIQEELESKLEEIKVLQGIIPICSYCHNIRDDEGAWDQIEAYLSKHSDAQFSHGICPKCLVKARDDAGLDKDR